MNVISRGVEGRFLDVYTYDWHLEGGLYKTIA